MWMYATILLLAFFFPPPLFLKNHAVYDAETQRYRSADWRPHPPGKRKACSAAAVSPASASASAASATSGKGKGGGGDGRARLLRGARAEVRMEKRAKRMCEMAMEVEEGEERWIEGRRVGTDLLFG